eukprot:scaffold99836_cov54-Phaeocystis_antarctica.AAC.2
MLASTAAVVLAQGPGAHHVGVADGLDLVDVVLLAQPVELLEDVRQDAQHLSRVRVGVRDRVGVAESAVKPTMSACSTVHCGKT